MLHASQHARMSYARVQPLLPISSIEEIVGFDPPEARWKKETRIQTTSSVQRIPTPQEIARSSVRHITPPLITPVTAARAAPTFLTQRTRMARRMAWPVFLCGFIAGIFGGLAFVKSPAGQKPAVQHVVQRANAMMKSVVR